MRPIKVLVVCATSLATSTMAAVKLEAEFKSRGIPVQINKGRIMDMHPLIRQTKPDIVIATAVVKQDLGIPTFSGVPLLSGKGLDGLFEQIFQAVDSIVKEIS